MAISYYSEDVKVPSFKRRVVSDWIKSVAKGYGKEIGEVTYLFCNDEYILDANKKFLDHDYYTDVITFDRSIDDLLIADILISLDTVESNAAQFDQPVEREILRVVIHGILHACGEDDKQPQSEIAMRQAEERALALLPDKKDEVWRKV